MIERNDLYDYGLYIYQNKDYFKFSVDSILLAEFVNLKNNVKILDMCTGNAPIPLILTTKNKSIEIDAVEIQKKVYDLAKKSIKENKLTNINVYNKNIKNFVESKKYDIITCNPPYFKLNANGEINKSEVKSIARHEVTITLKEVIDSAYKHLNETGSFYMVHRIDRLMETIDILKEKKLGIRRICFVFTKETKNAEFFLIETSKYKKTDPKITYKNIDNIKTYKNIF